MRVIVVLLLILCMLSRYHDLIWCMDLSQTLWQKSSQIPKQTYNLMLKNNNTTKADSRNNISQVFDHESPQKSTQTEIIKCYNCDNTMRIKGFTKYYTDDYSRMKAINYYKYKVAIEDSVWSTGTKIFISLWSLNITNCSNDINNINNNNKDVNTDSNVNDKLNNDNNEIEFHADLTDNEHKMIIGETSNNVRDDSGANIEKCIIILKYVQILITSKIL